MAQYSYKLFPREYHSWCGLRQRCNNPKLKRYPHYGGRGITYCERWRSFYNFMEDMGACPPKYSIDRIDNDGNYCKENCRWADNETQRSNTTKNFFLVSEDGVKKTMRQWIRFLNLKSSRVRQRYYVLHWDLNRCFDYKLNLKAYRTRT